MKKRIYGLETEYALTVVKPDGRWSCASRDMTPSLDFMGQYLKCEFMPNGSRIYKDVGNHPEYCTAECTNLIDLISQDKAGENILSKVFAKAAESQKDVKHLILFKNNCDYFYDEPNSNYYHDPATFGCHENFLTDARLVQDDLAAVLVPFLVVRQIVAGSGWVADPPHQFLTHNIRYSISQRSRFISLKVGDVTRLGPRAIFCNARWNEPHADNEKYRRLHLLLGDSNMSELSAYLKMGLIGILLEMLEERFPLKDLLSNYALMDPVKALHAVSLDLTCKEPLIELISGRYISAIDLFWVYIDAIRRYDNSYGLNEESANVLRMAIDILQRLERRQVDPETLMEIDSQGLDEELDWLIKKSFLEYVLKEFGGHWNNFYQQSSLYDQIRAKDLRYHDISREGIYYNWLSEQPDLPPSEIRSFNARTPRMVEKERIKNMEESPPQDNRSKVRGEILKFLTEKGYRSSCTVNWNRISLSQYEREDYYEGFLIDLKDPFITESESADYLKRAL